MKINVVPARELTAGHLSTWDEIQSADGGLESPFFRPEFTQAVERARPGVEVAVIEEDGRPVGFLPFQRRSRRVAGPVGGSMSDFHGLILHPAYSVDLCQLLRSCGLSVWHFDHLVARQAAFDAYRCTVQGSAYIDTSAGFEAYCAERRQAGSLIVNKTLQKLRKIEREVGPVRFEVSTIDPHVLGSLMRWKGAQCHRSLLINYFAVPWISELFHSLVHSTAREFSAVMSAFYAAGELQAALYCLRSRHVLHVWVTAYNPHFARYSPGYQLLLKLIEAAPSMGIQRIDLGPGAEPFKRSFGSGATSIAQGSVDLFPAAHHVRRFWRRMRHLVHESPLRKPATTTWRLLRWIDRRFAYH
jgi:CelD/BcsL family acetyltransferase involved in cellulose biosynthesis